MPTTKKMLKTAAAAALLLVLAACGTERLNLPVPGALSAQKTAQLEKGVTTKAQVEAQFGKPLDVLLLESGETWFFKDFNLRALHIEFDKNGVVSDYHYAD